MSGTQLDEDLWPVAQVVEPQLQVVTTTGIAGAVQAGTLVGQQPGDSEAERVAAIEDRVYATSLAIVDDMNHWAEVEPDTEEPPEQWVRELGRDGAIRRLRVAKASWMPLKDAPIGISASKSIVSSMAKSRAIRDAGRGSLNLNVLAVFPTQAHVYDELIVKDD